MKVYATLTTILLIFFIFTTYVKNYDANKWEDSFWYMNKLCKKEQSELRMYKDKYGLDIYNHM